MKSASVTSSPYSGPVSAYGVNGETLTAYIAKVNAEGGINGRMLRFFSYDDAYSPPRTVELARRLVERDDVLLIYNPLGTPGNLAIRDYLNKEGVPQLFVAAISDLFARPDEYPWTVVWGPSGTTQGSIFGRYIIDNIPDPRIGVLYQNDDFGRDLLRGLNDAIAGRAPVTALSYEVSDPSVDSQVLNLRAAGANAFMIFATPRHASQAIRRAGELGWRPVSFVPNVTASVAAVLEPAGLNHATGILSLEYYKDPSDPTWSDDPAMAEWRAFMNTYYPRGDQRNTGTVYGYILGQVLTEVLRRAGDDLSRENVLRVATSLDRFSIPQLLPGVSVTTGPDDYYPIEELRLRRFSGTAWELFGDAINPGR